MLVSCKDRPGKVYQLSPSADYTKESSWILIGDTSDLETHINNKSNPHEVTKDQVGLGNVDNTSDANKPISSATQNALNSKFNASDGNALK
ncbi:MAG: hypothetical protein [Bacteriophage sp.]|nr:MAG: hypothetical protein [Bacteriophage sp.]